MNKIMNEDANNKIKEIYSSIIVNNFKDVKINDLDNTVIFEFLEQNINLTTQKTYTQMLKDILIDSFKNFMLKESDKPKISNDNKSLDSSFDSFKEMLFKHLKSVVQSYEAILKDLQKFCQETNKEKDARFKDFEIHVNLKSLDDIYRLVFINELNVTEIKLLKLNQPFVVPKTMHNLLYWPNIGIDIWFPDLVFSKKNIHEIKSFISSKHNKIPAKKNIKIISEKSLLDGNPTEAFSTDSLKEYFLNNIKFYRRSKLMSSLLVSNIAEMCVQIIWDIDQFASIRKALALETVTTFNAFEYDYETTNFINENGIYLKNCITPTMSLEFTRNNKQLEDEFVSLKIFREHLLDTIKNNETTEGAEVDICKDFEEICKNMLIFRCLKCKLAFYGDNFFDRIVEHLGKTHPYFNSPIACTNCSKQFTIYEITGTKWYHKCDSDKNLNVATTSTKA